MRKSTLAACALALAILVLAVTKDRWLPPNWNAEWHQAWLEPSRETSDPRQNLLEDHQSRMAGIESELRGKIDREKVRHLELTRRIEELRKSDNRP